MGRSRSWASLATQQHLSAAVVVEGLGGLDEEGGAWAMATTPSHWWAMLGKAAAASQVIRHAPSQGPTSLRIANPHLQSTERCQ